MITVHHLCVSQSERIAWLCEELGVPYELKRYTRDAQTMLAPADYKALHPLGTAPVISDGALVLPESGAIIDYIIGKYGHGRLALKPEDEDFAQYVFWFHFANGSLMPNMMVHLVLALSGAQPNDNAALESLKARAGKALALAEARLAAAPYFAGTQFTAADIIMFFPLTTMRSFMPIDLAAYPNIQAYLRRIGERPAYRRAMAHGDPDMAPKLD